MPHESRILMKGHETLLDVCMESHMSYTGSSDPLPENELRRNVSVLQTAINHWKPGLLRSKRFDDAVLELCLATIAEVENDNVMTNINKEIEKTKKLKEVVRVMGGFINPHCMVPKNYLKSWLDTLSSIIEED